jgi:tRNA threonylcarbamoyl adenosine modification protein YeaZ
MVPSGCFGRSGERASARVIHEALYEGRQGTVLRLALHPNPDSPYNRGGMLVLSLDTTSEAGGVAIFRDGECLAESPHWETGNYSVALFEGLDRVLQTANLRFEEIELFAVANGPGSFTGIRTGLAAALGWSKACARPARGVSVLNALVRASTPETDFAIPILDARRGEFYGAIYRRTQPQNPNSGASSGLRCSSFSQVGEGFVLSPAALQNLILPMVHDNTTLTCVAREHEAASQDLRKSLSGEIGWTSIRGNLLAAIARVAQKEQIEAPQATSMNLDACYIRRTDAENKWKD